MLQNFPGSPTWFHAKIVVQPVRAQDLFLVRHADCGKHLICDPEREGGATRDAAELLPKAITALEQVAEAVSGQRFLADLPETTG